MYKIIKCQVVAAEGLSNIGINPNYRITMGYDNTAKTIKVVVDRVNRPDLQRDENAVLTYDEVASREFTTADFKKLSDNLVWFVQFDVPTLTISDPIEVWDWVESNKNKSVPPANTPYHSGPLQTDFAAHFSEDLLPLFNLHSFNKEVSLFDDCLLQFWISGDGTSPADTVVTNTDAELFAGTMQKAQWLSDNILTDVTFEILDSAGNILNATQTNTYPKRHRKVTLAPADEYVVRCVFNKPALETASNTFDVSVVNGSVNKNRIIIGEGSSDILVNTRGLNPGDFAKVKLNIGKFISFAELWIEFQ